MRTYDKDDIAYDFTDKDGWLTTATSEGGKKRLTFEVGHHAFRKTPKKGNTPTSAEVLEKLLEHPEKVSVVLSDAPDDGNYHMFEPWGCITTCVCDAAGLIPKGNTIICLTLEEYTFTESADGSYSYGWRERQDLYGSTAQKHDELARELVESGATLVAAPVGWDGPDPVCRITGWKESRRYSYEFAFAERPNHATSHIQSRIFPILDADTPDLRKMAGSFAGDEAERQRKMALTYSKDVFKGLEIEAPQAVELLSYGLVAWEETKSKSYKVPVWKKKIIEPTVEHFPEFNGGTGKDDVASKLHACRNIWAASLDAYGIMFKKGEVEPAEIVRVWKEIGSAMGVDSSIEAVLVHGVPAEDVIAAL